MLLRRLQNPGTTGLIYRRVYDDLKRNHIDKFFEEFPSLFKFYRATDHEVVLPSEGENPPSRIVFAYAETETEVKRKFHGPEYMDMFVDQGEQLTELELEIMRTCCRWPGTTQNQCKFVVFFNPGGIGISYFKRVFKDKKFRNLERPSDFAFIQAYGWDNVEWARSALIEDGLTEEDFYTWSNEKRFDHFINRTQYGRQLNALPPAMRIGHLMGSFDNPAGQYFDVWDPMYQVKSDLGITPWHPKWISIDWGFAHPSAVLWHAQDEAVTKTYREFVRAGLGPRELAQAIIDRCKLEDEKENIDAVYLSPDAFAKRTTEDSIAQQIGDVLKSAGLPRPRPADNDRVSGWVLMYEMLKYGRWVVSKNCSELIDNIPMFTRDEKEPEDCVKFDGDDPGDSARYGLKSRFSSREAPKEVQLANRMNQVQKSLSDKPLELVNTMMHMEHLKFNQAYAKKHQPVRRIRRWRP